MADISSRVALVTCSELPGADGDTRLLFDPLEAHRVEAVPAVWDDPSVDWSSFDLSVVRSCWDYPTRRSEFVSWAARVPRLENPARVLEWNTDKRYLAELSARGIPVISTTWVRPNDIWQPPGEAQYVIKPAVSLSALDSGRYDLGDAAQRRLAARHVRRLQAAGRTVMVQPYMTRIDDHGETSLVFIAGWFSHAMRRGAVLDGPDRGVDKRFTPDGGLDLRRREPSPEEMALAQRTLDVIPGADRLLYARVDLVLGGEGTPLVMEVELTEPHLYLGMVPEAIDRFAAAIAVRARAADYAAF